jgi:outer membrane protein assembly factor BamB
MCALGAVCLFALGLSLGCGRGLHTASDAVAWPSLSKDPAEDGRDLDRWPGWRGRNGQGIAAGGDPPLRFGPSAGVRWAVDVRPGNSSPVAWADRVFLTAQLDDRDPPTLGVIALDRHDGRLLWRTPAGSARGPSHEKNGFASASVVTDGQRVMACFGATGLFCFDFSGRLLWKAELGQLEQQWGMAASPILYENLVVQLCDSERESFLAAFDRSTGRTVWRVPRRSLACWSTPIVVHAPTARSLRAELIVNGTSGADETDGWVIAYAPADGRELWRQRGTTHLVTPTLLVGRDLVFSLSGRNGPLMALRPGERAGPAEGRVVWRCPRGGPYIPSGVVYRQRLYVLTDPGILSCYNPGNGEELGRLRLRGPFSASLVAAAGRIYAVNERGTVYVISAGDAPQLLAQNPLGERALATPAIVAGDLLLRTQRRLYCFAGRP